MGGEDAIFSWFKSAKPVEDTTPLRQRLDQFEVRIRRVEEDWTEVYNKFRTLQMRVAKQVQRLDANSSQEEPQRVESGAENARGHDVVTSAGASLSPRMQRIQEQILERRRRAPSAGVAKEGGE